MWENLGEPWQVCLESAWESYREGSVPIGAAIVDPQGRIVAQGRNRRAGGLGGTENQITAGPLAHAEVNAILALDTSGLDPRSCELYTLVEPCPLCVGAICMANIKVVHYAAADAWSGSTDLLQASRYLRWKAIRASAANIPHLVSIVHMVQVDEWIRREHPRLVEVFECWSRAYPADVRLGQKLHDSGELRRFADQGHSAQEAVVRLEELMAEWAPDHTDAA